MRTINVETIDGIQKETVYEINELSYLGKLFKFGTSKKRGVTYLECPCAFDIETTNIYEKDEKGKIKKEPRAFAFMYHWQFCLDDQVVFGRTWEEFTKLLASLERNMNLSLKNRLVIWVHNLPFEFIFCHWFLDVAEAFCTEERKPLRICTTGGIEFRCSYALSNMSLSKFCKNETGVKHYKLSGDKFNYDKIRTAITKMEEYEEGYCYNDVRGLCECISSRLEHDTLAHIPMTSTGYVRRDMRKAVAGDKKYREKFHNMALTPELYKKCRLAFRGGDTHANNMWVDQLIEGFIHGRDITSSYPASMMMDLFPSTQFFRLQVSTFVNRDMSDFAMLITVRFRDIHYVGKCGIPYISLAKCTKFLGDKLIDNGRVLYATDLIMTITDIDYNIILQEYQFDDILIHDIWASRYAELDKPIKNTIMDYYRAKTALKGDLEHIYEYNKAKNSLNSTYGCMVQRIDQEETIYKDHAYETIKKPLEEQLAKYYKSRNSFLSYQVGVWITARSRKRLREMLWQVGEDVLYCDTDSIKFINDHEEAFNKKNEEIKKKAIECGAYAETRSGEIKYMGLWEDEYGDSVDGFKTLGAKKYCYRQDGFIHSTIAGVSKSAGEIFFNADEGFDNFEIGKTIPESGHLTAYYNDVGIHKITVNGCTMTSASNVAIIDNIYTLGVTEEYLDLIEKALENVRDINYI